MRLGRGGPLGGAERLALWQALTGVLVMRNGAGGAVPVPVPMPMSTTAAGEADRGGRHQKAQGQ
jgi:hypothetical protein